MTHAAARLDYRLVPWTLQMVEGQFRHDPPAPGGLRARGHTFVTVSPLLRRAVTV